MKTSDFIYNLPQELIAQKPLDQRDSSRLMVLHRDTDLIEDRQFQDVSSYFREGDIIIANDSRVIPARIYGHKYKTGGRIEFLLLSQIDSTHWVAMGKGKKLTPGVEIVLHDRHGNDTAIVAAISKVLDGPLREIEFNVPTTTFLDKVGITPLPPYIEGQLDNPERYQTVFSNIEGSAAAPTAGLHFTKELISTLASKGVLFDTCTLHVGLDTFKPLAVEDVEDHLIHSEWISLTKETAQRINEAKSKGGRVIAVGTTTARVLETVGLRSNGISGSLQNISHEDSLNRIAETTELAGYEGFTDLFIYPGYKFNTVDALLTNFHLPQSSLMLMISAFAEAKQIKMAYQKAIALKYRFLSLGDAMLIL
ncbi:MAG: tRNA preQ1(34) S-adenosylmethionine ribosyltransferase-isomerase QueA [Rhodothermales bacterium]